MIIDVNYENKLLIIVNNMKYDKIYAINVMIYSIYLMIN